MTRGEIRVVAIDDHPLMLLGIAAASAQSEPRLRIVGTSATVADPKLAQRDASVAILDLRLSDGSLPTDNVHALHQAGLKVVAFADGEPASTLQRLVASGVAGLVLKTAPIEQLIHAVRCVAAGGTWVPPDLSARLSHSRANRPNLTDRELDVLTLLHQGLITKEVARQLALQESTIKEHIKRVRHKYASVGRPASTRIELLNRVIDDGYLTAR